MERAYRASARAGASWFTVVDSLAITMIIMAYMIFFYFMVGFRYLDAFYKPATIMTVMLTAGLTMGHSIVGIEWRLNYVSFSMATAGILATIAILGLTFIVGSVQMPAQGMVIEMSPILMVLFYTSVGVAEEALFTLGFFGALARQAAGSVRMVIIYAIFVSILFAAYHNFASIQIYGAPIFQVSNYSFVLFFGSFILKLAFYFTRHISVSMLGHSLLNGIVSSISAGVVKV